MRKFPLILSLILLFATSAFADSPVVHSPIGNFFPANSTSIANGATESAEINTGGAILTGFYIPAAFTGTTITFEAATAHAGTFVPVVNSGGAISITVTTSHYYTVDPKDFQGIQFLKLKSGSAEGAARTIIYSMRGID